MQHLKTDPHLPLRVRFTLVSAFAAALSGLIGCQPPDAGTNKPSTSTQTPSQEPLPPSQEPLPPPPAPDAKSLVFEVGSTRAQVEATMSSAIKDGHARIIRNHREQKANKHFSADVHTYELGFGPKQAVASVQLTLFSDTLVAVLTTYRAPDSARLTKLIEALGPSQTSEAWHGWWDPLQDLTLQLSTDLLRQEVFSLSAARPVAPEIDQAIQRAWIARYKTPPPWVTIAYPAATTPPQTPAAPQSPPPDPPAP